MISRFDSLSRLSGRRFLGWMALLLVCAWLQPNTLSGFENASLDSKQIKKLKKEYGKAIQGQQNDAAIDVTTPFWRSDFTENGLPQAAPRLLVLHVTGQKKITLPR